ncbi:hypothetical protein CAC42_4698 [Sphaceloma murrayae]|uniref:HIT-type domain-containing protein n=1 Tax=Sphaceloma murrayae TaxID=2082308 RepID=A0A2K1QNN8_9PEZI|nr:hypothetical protein CAC42_4698 [Sphaceloma murrayae]
MTTVECGVCVEQPSKYRCPSCDLRYCSIPCYKKHKTQHEEENQLASEQSVQQTRPKSPQPIPGARPRLPGQAKAYDFSGFEKDPVLLDLLNKDPQLRLRLQSVFGYTLEPPPGSRGGRGGFRGRGRGQSDRNFGSTHGGSWTQVKGDAEALEKLKGMRDEDGDGNVAEFIRLVGMRFGPDAKDTSASQQAKAAV